MSFITLRFRYSRIWVSIGLGGKLYAVCTVAMPTQRSVLWHRASVLRLDRRRADGSGCVYPVRTFTNLSTFFLSTFIITDTLLNYPRVAGVYTRTSEVRRVHGYWYELYFYDILRTLPSVFVGVTTVHSCEVGDLLLIDHDRLCTILLGLPVSRF